MQSMKKMLVLLVGLATFLYASPVFADQFEQLDITIPYVVHGGDWWTGLALSNMGGAEVNVRLGTLHTGTFVAGGDLTIPPYSQDVRLLPDFFTLSAYPTKDDGAASLWIGATGGYVNRDFRVSLFVGNKDGGFNFRTYDWHNKMQLRNAN